MAAGAALSAEWLNAILLSAQIVNEMPPPKTKHESVRKQWTAKMVLKWCRSTPRLRSENVALPAQTKHDHVRDQEGRQDARKQPQTPPDAAGNYARDARWDFVAVARVFVHSAVACSHALRPAL